MAQSNSILHTLKQCGFSDNEIVSAIRNASDPNDIAEITAIILETQKAKATKEVNADLVAMAKDLDSDSNDKALLKALQVSTKETPAKMKQPPQEIVLPPGWERCHTKSILSKSY